MTDIISYRGPDDYGYLAYNTQERFSCSFKEQFKSDKTYNLMFGHRRLSIIDLSSAGHQPMSYLNGRYWITYNGEVYNYLEIKEELIKKGYTFISGSDTEVILAAYHEWGIDCLHKFNGMWAFAVLDTERSHLFCARDRLGVKPFYYCFLNNVFSFASEIKQLLTLPWVKSDVHDGFIHDFFVLNSYYSINEETAFKHIKDMRGGHYLFLDCSRSSQPIIKKWWDIQPAKRTKDLKDKDCAIKYYNLLYDACVLRLRSDVKLGSALSGGLDSSGIVYMVNEILKGQGLSGNQYTFTASSEDIRYDETDYAQKIIANVNANAFFTTPSEQDLIKNLSKLIWHQEEPFGSTSIYASWCVARLVKEAGVTVSLDGQGPDELLGGYFPFVHIMAENITNWSLAALWGNMRGFNRHQGYPYSKMAKKTLGFLILSAFNNKLLINNHRKQFLNNDYYNDAKGQTILLKSKSYPTGVNSFFDKYSYLSVKNYPLPGILKSLDRNSMAFSVESRVPFLDYRLVEYTFNLPANQKINQGITKVVYRNAMRGLLPNDIINRHQKFGFVTAEPIWMRRELKELVLNAIAEQKHRHIFNYRHIETEFKNYLENKTTYSNLFWKFLCTEHWLNLFK